MLRRTVVFGLVLSAWACSDPTTASPPPAMTPVDAGFSDAAPGAMDAHVADAGPPVAEVCRDLGLEPLAMRDGDTTYAFGDVAGDFTVNTLYAGPWTLSENWTGCESYVFVAFIPTSGRFEEQLWASRSEVLVEETDPNAHFFFVSSEGTAADREDRVAQILGYIDSFIDFSFADPDERARQRRRFHYVTDAPDQITGSVGRFFADYLAYARDRNNAVDLGERGMAPPPLPFAFGIDRDQRWDSAGNLSQFVGGTPAFKMAAYLPGFYDHKARIRDSVASDTGVQTVVLLDERVEARVFEVDAMLPDATQMATFDTLEFDVSVNCPHRNVFACSEWDRIARIEVCLDSMCMERRELVRWITPYWRRGQRRWMIDASALMGFVADGGAQRLRIETGPSWERATSRDVRVALRLANRSKGLRAIGQMRAFTGGGFNGDYNTRDPFTFRPSANATRVELVVMVSGHGQADNTNCAEWCDHRHQFTVNGQAVPEIRHEGMIGSADGCGPAAARGVPPGQYGNWAPERAYWCPGLPVEHMRFDITGSVMLGQDNTIAYSASFRDMMTPAGGNIDLSAYIAWFE